MIPRLPFRWFFLAAMAGITTLLVCSPVPAAEWRGAFEVYWGASDVAGRREAALAILALDLPPDSLVAELRRGRHYSSDAAVGESTWTWVDAAGRDHHARLMVPDDYDPARRYPVYVYLHGNINRDPADAGDVWWQNPERLAFADRIVVYPTGWAESRWWQHSQVQHLDALLARLRREYNVDENRCYLGGVSDGGTGTWYQAMRAPTAWAGFLPFIGHPSVLNHPDEDAEGQVYPANLRNESLFVISGRNDAKYPTWALEPYLDLAREAGARVEHHAHDGGHDVRNWREQWSAMETFLHVRPRDPDPPWVVWRTEDVVRAPGAYSVRIDEIGATDHDVVFPRFSVIEDSVDGRRQSVLALVRDLPSGQVEVRHEGETWTVRTENVRWARILISVSRLEGTEFVRIVRADETLLEIPSRIDAATVLEWAARFDDRTRLVGLEVELDLASNRARTIRYEE